MSSRWIGVPGGGLPTGSAGWVSAGPLDPVAEHAIIQQLNFERRNGGAERRNPS